MSRMQRCSIWMAIVVVLCGGLTGSVTGQGGVEAVDPVETPEPVKIFFKDFIDLYMDNYSRIDRLKTLRTADVNQDARQLSEEIRRDSNERMADLKEHAREARAEANVRKSHLRSMNKLLNIYRLYVDKVVSDWEPSRKQVLQRRRMSDNEIIRSKPKLASSSFLRRVFLGELFSSAQTAIDMGSWLNERIGKVRRWLRSKYSALYPLFNKLVSEVDRVMDDDDADESEKQRVIEEVRNEWRTFWRDVGEESKWTQMRNTTNRLLSLFRNRSGRLPGFQETIKEKATSLQKQIGDLQRLQIERPFKKGEKRLMALLRLSKTFVYRAKKLGDGQGARAISKKVMTFVSEFMNRDPARFWGIENRERLQERKKQELEKIDLAFADFNRMKYKKHREIYNFPLDSIRRISNRLGTNYGKKEKELAKHVRKMATFVEDRYQLSTKGPEVMRSYRDALSQIDHSRPEGYVKFEQSFRDEHESTLDHLLARTNRNREMSNNLERLTEKVSRIRPKELAATFFEKNDDRTNNDREIR